MFVFNMIKCFVSKYRFGHDLHVFISMLLLYAGFISCFAPYFQVFTCFAAPRVHKSKETFSTGLANKKIKINQMRYFMKNVPL